jgi:hypothetical protein
VLDALLSRSALDCTLLTNPQSSLLCLGADSAMRLQSHCPILDPRSWSGTW